MTKHIRLNAFEMNCVAHQSPGLWRHPRDRSRDYKTLQYWTELAQTLERGKFDGLFIADVLGTYDVYGGSPDAALRNAIQVPVNDPLLLVSAMANVTQHLGFGITVTLSYEPPFPFARRMTTLDHLTNGRIGWNIVTGYLDSAARGAGRDGQNAHDDRYAVAEDYMRLVYRLWEGSWADDAVVADPVTGLYARPERVRRIDHEGPHFRASAIHLGEPSPQRTPVLYQAGTSPAGRGFAAKHAECVFISGPSKKVIGPRVAALRKAVADAGRQLNEILIFTLMTVILAPTDDEAKAKLADYRRYASLEGALTLMSGWTGVDFSRLEPDQVVQHVENDAGRTALENITRADPDRVWTVREVAEHVAVGGIDETDIDGFNLAFAVRPETFAEVADLLVPELQRRGRYKTGYAAGTLREKLFGQAARLPGHHPAAAFRWD
jgi:FMN-dependent oxidoreductase (nitrilotriacetate monooxygenase family)